MTGDLIRTPLHEKHAALEASFGDVAGWEMPLSYRGAIEEAEMVRSRAGVFDLGHSARIRIRGDGALDLLEFACTHDVAHQEDNTVAQTLLLDERAHIVDLARLVRLENDWLLVASPINRQAVVEHLSALNERFGAKVEDRTEKDSTLLVAGPEAPRLLDSVLEGVLGEKVSAIAPAGARSGSHLLARYVVARTDEIGLWSAEVVLPNLFIGQAWRFITQKAGESCIAPAGLAAWDIIRIEAGAPVFGREINSSFDPYMAGLSGLVHLNHEFLGAGACRTLSAKTPARRLVGLVLDSAEAPIPRHGAEVLDSEGIEIGAVTSGTFSPLRGCPIAMAYVAASASQPGAIVTVVGDGNRFQAKLSELPFKT